MLGLLAEESLLIRNLILNYQGLNKLISFMKKTKNRTGLAIGLWAMSIFCGGSIVVYDEMLKEAISFLTELVLKEDDVFLLNNATLALSDFSKRNDELMFQCSIESGCLKKIVSLLRFERNN